MKLPYWAGDCARQLFYLALGCGLLLVYENIMFHDPGGALTIALIAVCAAWGHGHQVGYRRGERETHERRNTADRLSKK